MEHLVKRNPDFLLNIATKRKVKAGQSGGLTQSRIGSPPFQLDKNNLPINVKRGDTVWLMESGYGVYAKYKVSRVSSTQKITSLHELDAIRISFDFSFQLQDDFWNNEENKLTKAISKNKALYFTHIATENAEDIEDFPVITKPGLASSWIYLTLDKKKEFFSLRGKKTCEEVVVENNLKEYGNIPASVKYKVAKIWKYKTVTGKSMHETEHDLDHLVPKSIGGPGIFPENIVPLQSGLNRYKSNRIPISFARIAHTYKQVTFDAYTEIDGIQQLTILLRDLRDEYWNQINENQECSIMPEVGPCDGICPTYYFNQNTNQCEEFITGCCGIEAFDTMQGCMDACE